MTTDCYNRYRMSLRICVADAAYKYAREHIYGGAREDYYLKRAKLLYAYERFISRYCPDPKEEEHSFVYLTDDDGNALTDENETIFLYSDHDENFIDGSNECITEEDIEAVKKRADLICKEC